MAPAARTLDRYTDWLVETAIPAARERALISSGPKAIGLDGCSMGGSVAMEVFLRRPELFGTLGSVQGAFSVASAERYAERIARACERVGPRPIHLESSGTDPYRRANEAFARRLGQLGLNHELIVPPGPHDQPWLREVGTLEMLLWHDRALGGQ